MKHRNEKLALDSQTKKMQGIVGSGIGFAIMSWCIQVRGPLYVSMFSPLLLVVVAIVGWAILGEKIHVGRCLNSVCFFSDNWRPLNL